MRERALSAPPIRSALQSQPGAARIQCTRQCRRCGEVTRCSRARFGSGRASLCSSRPASAHPDMARQGARSADATPARSDFYARSDELRDWPPAEQAMTMLRWQETATSVDIAGFPAATSRTRSFRRRRSPRRRHTARAVIRSRRSRGEIDGVLAAWVRAKARRRPGRDARIRAGGERLPRREWTDEIGGHRHYVRHPLRGNRARRARLSRTTTSKR